MKNITRKTQRLNHLEPLPTLNIQPIFKVNGLNVNSKTWKMNKRTWLECHHKHEIFYPIENGLQVQYPKNGKTITVTIFEYKNYHSIYTSVLKID